MFRSLRCRPTRVRIVIALVVIAVLMFLYAVSNNDNASESIIIESQKFNHPKNIQMNQNTGGHRMCILIPFRDRFEELTEFVPKITAFLKRQNVQHKIVVVNQVYEND